MKDQNFDTNLKKQIQQLPDLKPGLEVWDAVESRLNFEERLIKYKKDLPQYQPKAKVWNNITGRLNIENSTNIYQTRKSIIVLASAIAASLILFVTIYYKADHHKDITISEEIIMSENSINFQWNEREPMDYINEQCKSQNLICKTPEFIENKKQLEELNAELKQLNEVIEKYGESTALIKSVIKLENLKTEIILELMNSLNS